MLENFNIFGIEHSLSIAIPVLIGVIFILSALKYPKKQKIISISLALTIILIRSVRYIFDVQLGNFEILDLLSIHVCHIDLILLSIGLTWPNKKLFTFTFLIGIPTALAVALMPGQTHPDPGMSRAIFFIMSHVMLVMGSIFLLIVHRFRITKKELIFYYAFSLAGMILVFIFNIVTDSNYMYLMEGPKNTLLGSMYSGLGPILYLISIYIILLLLITTMYFIHKLILLKYLKSNGNKIE